MKIPTFIILTSLGLFFFCDLEKGWKGIKVFESSRTDVEMKLGKPVKDEEGEVRYENDEAQFRFLYSIGPCKAPETLRGGYNVSEGRVLQYEVRPKKIITIGELGIDMDVYSRAEDPEVLQFANYSNTKAGIFITVLKMSEPNKEIVRAISFERTQEQVTKFRCISNENS